MANPNAQNVSVGKPKAAGGIWSGEVTETPPTDATTALDAGLSGLGYVSDEGLTNGVEIENEDIIAWGGDKVLTVRTSRSETFSWTFIETNELVLAEVYGPDNVTGDPATGLTVLHNNKDLPNRLYVFEILLTGNRVKRIVVPNGQVTEIDDVQYVDGEAIGYTVTLSCYPDEDGNTVYEYIASTESGGTDE